MSDLPAEVEQRLANMSDADWDVLVAKLRAPDRAESFREAASKVIDGGRLDAVCQVANLAQFTGEDGAIDEAKVINSLRAVFGIPPTPQRHENFGQYTQQPNMGGPGDAGRAEAEKRFGPRGYVAGGQQTAPLTPPPVGPGSAGAREAARRFSEKGGA
jgi:hypothetical protein